MVISDVGTKENPRSRDERSEGAEKTEKQPKTGSDTAYATVRIREVTSDLSIGDGVYHEKGDSTDDAACMVRVVKVLGVRVSRGSIDEDPPANGEQTSGKYRAQQIPFVTDAGAVQTLDAGHLSGAEYLGEQRVKRNSRQDSLHCHNHAMIMREHVS